MAIGRTEDRTKPVGPCGTLEVTCMFGARSAHSIWASSHQLHRQAGHMTASDQIGTPPHQLAKRGPSTYRVPARAAARLGRDDSV